MSAGFSDLLNALGLWLGGRKSTPSVTDVVALVALLEWPLNTALTELPTASGEVLALDQMTVTLLASATSEVLAPLNSSILETAVIR